MRNVTSLTKTEVQQFAKNWFRKLDQHAPIEELLPMLAENGLEMSFPEKLVTSLSDFEDWYRGVSIFFDQSHEIKNCDIKVSGEMADVNILVKWEASRWNSSILKDERIILNAYQTWVVKRSPKNGQLVIATYNVQLDKDSDA